jgi:hypothetical protein
MQIELASLVSFCNPVFLYVEAGNLETLRERVAEANSSEGAIPYSAMVPIQKHEQYNHFARIKWLMENGWQEPISIEVGIPSLGFVPEWMIDDGNHRTAAAMLMGRETIEVEFSGSVAYFEELFKPEKSNIG